MKIKNCKAGLRTVCLAFAILFILGIPAVAVATTQFASDAYDLYEENAADVQPDAYLQVSYPQDDGAEVPKQSDIPAENVDEPTASEEDEIFMCAEGALYQEIQPFVLDYGAAFITSVQLLDADGNPQTVFGYYEAFQIHFTFSIPNEIPINAGDSMTVTIPPPLLLISFPTAYLIDSDGNIIGEFSGNPATGIVTVTFTTDLPSGARGRQGSFWFGMSWDRDFVNVGDDFYIILPGNDVGQIYTVGDAIQIDPGERLWKYGWLSDCANYISWMIRVNAAEDDIPNAVLHDALPAGLELVQHYWGIYDVFIEVGQMVGGAFTRQGSYFPDEHGRLTVGAGGFTVTLGNLIYGYSTAMPDGSLPNAVTLRVIYNTRIVEPHESFTNVARLTGDGIDETVTSTIRPIADGGIRWYYVDFNAYKEVYGEVGYLESSETFLFEITNIETDQVVAWGRAVVNQSGVPIAVDFYSNAERTTRMSHTWPVLKSGHTYRLDEIDTDGWVVTYFGGEGSEGNQFLICEDLVNEDDTIVIKFVVQNAEYSGNGGDDPGNGGGNPGNGGDNPGNGGGNPGNGGDSPGNGGDNPGNGGDNPGNGGVNPVNGGVNPGNDDGNPGNGGDNPGSDGDNHNSSDDNPSNSGDNSDNIHEYLTDEYIPLAHMSDDSSDEIVAEVAPITGRVNPQTGDEFNYTRLIASLTTLIIFIGILIIIVRQKEKSV